MNLFELKLNEVGVKSIKRFEKITRRTMVLVIIVMSILLLEAWTSFFLSLNTKFGESALTLFQVRLYPFYISMHSILAYFQAQYFVKTGTKLSFAVDNNDEIAFNHSFVLLLKNSIFNLLGLSLGLLMTVFRIITYLVPYYL